MKTKKVLAASDASQVQRKAAGKKSEANWKMGLKHK